MKTTPSREPGHAGYVDAWLNRTTRRQPADHLVTIFERAVGALWRRAQRTLGEVTLAAIADRVLFTASEKFQFLATLTIDSTGIRFDELRHQGVAAHDRRLRDAVRFVLVELLTVIGNLTDEILTPALHSELSKLEFDDLGRDSDEARREARRTGEDGAAAEGATT